MILSQFNSPQYHFNLTKAVIYIENFQVEQLFNRNLSEKLFQHFVQGMNCGPTSARYSHHLSHFPLLVLSAKNIIAHACALPSICKLINGKIAKIHHFSLIYHVHVSIFKNTSKLNLKTERPNYPLFGNSSGSPK